MTIKITEGAPVTAVVSTCALCTKTRHEFLSTDPVMSEANLLEVLQDRNGHDHWRHSLLNTGWLTDGTDDICYACVREINSVPAPDPQLIRATFDLTLPYRHREEVFRALTDQLMDGVEHYAGKLGPVVYVEMSTLKFRNEEQNG